jgi:hypothetical protein
MRIKAYANCAIGALIRSGGTMCEGKSIIPVLRQEGSPQTSPPNKRSKLDHGDAVMAEDTGVREGFNPSRKRKRLIS